MGESSSPVGTQHQLSYLFPVRIAVQYQYKHV